MRLSSLVVALAATLTLPAAQAAALPIFPASAQAAANLTSRHSSQAGTERDNSARSIEGAIIFGESGFLTTSRMDPIVNPGTLAGHVHQVMGASGFRHILNTPEDQGKSQCSSMKVKADMSNYWTPNLYWINDNGTFLAMSGGTRIYYKLRNSTTPIAAFPKGMRMVSGLAMKRDSGAIQTQGVQLTLDAYLGVATNPQYLPNGTVHPDPPGQDYVQMNILFPNCGWANQSLDSWDHFSHMSWQVNRGGEWQENTNTCPESHPIMYPQLFIESFFFLEPWMKAAWKKDKPNFIISNGDTTGVTWHGDFVSGWDTQMLQDAIDHCYNVGDNLEDCPAFKDSMQYKDYKLQDCRIQSQIPDEEVGLYRPLEHLPGCNPVWDWDGPADKPTDCPWYTTPGWTSPTHQYMGGPQPYQVPVVLPGYDTSNIADLVPSSGFRGNSGPSRNWVPYLLPWAKDHTGKNNVSSVMFGTQAEVDANRVEIKGVNDQPAAFGMDGWAAESWEGMVAGSDRLSPDRVQLMIRGAVSNVKKSRKCQQRVWGGLPCSEDPPQASSPEPPQSTTSVAPPAASSSAGPVDNGNGSGSSSSSNSAPQVGAAYGGRKTPTMAPTNTATATTTTVTPTASVDGAPAAPARVKALFVRPPSEEVSPATASGFSRCRRTLKGPTERQQQEESSRLSARMRLIRRRRKAAPPARPAGTPNHWLTTRS